MKNIGLVISKSALDYTATELREFLSNHGVVLFRNQYLSHAEQIQVMSRIGVIQNYVEQQAPKAYTDHTDPDVILLNNNDFLGKSRMGWHMDQTYLRSDYLPIRSLYCREVLGKNITEFADIAVLTDAVLEEFNLTSFQEAKYYIDNLRTRFSQRSIFSACKHIGRTLLRYDNRMEFVDRQDSLAFKQFGQSFLDSDACPKFSVDWQVNDFVIFDNNRCPHRRSEMNGQCKLSRLTSKFWYENEK